MFQLVQVLLQLFGLKNGEGLSLASSFAMFHHFVMMVLLIIGVIGISSTDFFNSAMECQADDTKFQSYINSLCWSHDVFVFPLR